MLWSAECMIERMSVFDKVDLVIWLCNKFVKYWYGKKIWSYNWAVTWHFQQCGMCDLQSLRSACAYEQSDQSLCLPLAYSTTVELLTERHLEFLSFKGGCPSSSESTHVKMPHCWKSHVTAHVLYVAFCHCLFTCIYYITIQIRDVIDHFRPVRKLIELTLEKKVLYCKNTILACIWSDL